MLKASEHMRAAGLPAPIIYTTTAGNPDTKEGAFALKIIESALPFTEALYDLPNREALLDVISKNAQSKMLHLEFSYRQLGYSDEWFHEAAARSHSSQDDINRDLLNIWQSSSDKNIIPQHIITKMRANRREPNYVDLSEGFVMRWYHDRSEVETTRFQQRPFIMGMDTSENIGRDYTTSTILDPSDMHVVATCRCNEANTMQVARYVLKLLLKYPSLVFIPERNNTGTAIIDFVIEELTKRKINPYTRIYNEVVQHLGDDKYKTTNIYDYTTLTGKERSSFGYRTTGSSSTGTSRELLYKIVMMKTLEMNHSKLFDNTLISEYCNLTVRNGRIDHREGLHDDVVISHLLGSYMIFFGRNLHIYGLSNEVILANIPGSQPINVNVKNEQIAVRSRIAELENILSTNPPYLLKKAYTRELQNLKPLVREDLTEVTPIAVAQVQNVEQQLSRSTGPAQQAQLRNYITNFNNLRNRFGI